MSRAERRSFEIDETKRMCYAQFGPFCWCGDPANQLGHQLPQDELHKARYGERVVHHWSNMRPTCSLRHNARVEIDYRTRPIEADRKAEEIRQRIREEECL